MAAARRGSGELEREILACLAAAPDPMSPGQVREALSADSAYTTVMTTLGRMYRKRALLRERRGRAYVYALPDSPAAARASMVAFHMSQLLENQHDRAGVLAQFVNHLEAGDEQLLRELLRRTRRRS